MKYLKILHLDISIYKYLSQNDFNLTKYELQRWVGSYDTGLAAKHKPPVAQLDKALPSGGRDRRFKFCRAGQSTLSSV
jgi:hypothetical protein